jgi:acyl carrier protein
MMDVNTKIKVFEIVNKVSGGRVTSINPDGDVRQELSLDSIQIVELFAMLENEFNIELPLTILNVKTGREFLDIIEKSIDKSLKKVKQI